MCHTYIWSTRTADEHGPLTRDSCTRTPTSQDNLTCANDPSRDLRTRTRNPASLTSLHRSALARDAGAFRMRTSSLTRMPTLTTSPSDAVLALPLSVSRSLTAALSSQQQQYSPQQRLGESRGGGGRRSSAASSNAYITRRSPREKALHHMHKEARQACDAIARFERLQATTVYPLHMSKQQLIYQVSLVLTCVHVVIPTCSAIVKEGISLHSRRMGLAVFGVQCTCSRERLCGPAVLTSRGLPS